MVTAASMGQLLSGCGHDVHVNNTPVEDHVTESRVRSTVK